MENRNGLVVDARLTHATGTAEPALEMLDALADSGVKTVGAARISLIQPPCIFFHLNINNIFFFIYGNRPNWPAVIT